MEQLIQQLRQNVSTGVMACAILMLLTVFYFYENILRIVPTILTQDITTIYHLNAKQLGVLVAAFYFVYAPMQLFVGTMLDRYGSRWLITVAILSCALGIALFSVAESYWVILVARFLMGFGASFAFVSAINILNATFEGRHFALLTGLVIAIGVLGGVFGAVLVRHLMIGAGWRLACLDLSLVGLILASVAYFLLRKKSVGSVDMTFNERFCAFSDVVSGVRTLLSNAQFWINALIASLFYIPILGFTTTWQTNFLQQVRYFNFVTASNSLVVVLFGWGLGAPFFGWLSQKIKRERLLISLAATVTTILLASIVYVPHLSFSMLHILLFMFGFSSSVHAINFSIAKRLASEHLLASSVALTNMVIMVGSIAICFLGVLLDWVWQGDFVQDLPRYSEANYQAAFSILLAASFVALVLSFFLRESYE